MNRYLVKNDAGSEICTGILQMFYGNLWEAVMDRLERQFDGYVRSVFFGGWEYRVYRRADAMELTPETARGGEDAAYSHSQEIVAR